MLSLALIQVLSLLSSAAAQKYWFSFGDSYTQTGFNLTTGPLPTVGNPLGNPPYPGFTATGGENWVDYVTTTYNKSLVLTYNMAYGGATIDSNLVTPYEPTVLSLTDQINDFLESTSILPAWKSANTLFSVWIGVNDIGNSYYASGDRDAFSDVLLDAYFALIENLLYYALSGLVYDSAKGARNFLFANVPPIDRSPLMLAQSASAQALEDTVIQGFNAKLVTRVNNLKSTHAGVKTFVWDSNAIFTRILNSPTTYGFKDATTFGTGSDIFWGNNYHPSSYAHKFFGQDVAQVLGGFL